MHCALTRKKPCTVLSRVCTGCHVMTQYALCSAGEIPCLTKPFIAIDCKGENPGKDVAKFEDIHFEELCASLCAEKVCDFQHEQDSWRTKNGFDDDDGVDAANQTWKEGLKNTVKEFQSRHIQIQGWRIRIELLQQLPLTTYPDRASCRDLAYPDPDIFGPSSRQKLAYQTDTRLRKME
ncbi:hypothetical protein V8G54_000437 [Vigna mungo]|uniref:Uncharacterized protein n=1 Tax=Vigna mungo TaxID=3915 RepID=A0AAQ3P8N0_VIGMU